VAHEAIGIDDVDAVLGRERGEEIREVGVVALATFDAIAAAPASRCIDNSECMDAAMTKSIGDRTLSVGSREIGNHQVDAQ